MAALAPTIQNERAGNSPPRYTDFIGQWMTTNYPSLWPVPANDPSLSGVNAEGEAALAANAAAAATSAALTTALALAEAAAVAAGYPVPGPLINT